MHLARPNVIYFKSNYGSRAPLVIYKGTEATALPSKSIRLHLGHLNAVEEYEYLAFLSVEFYESRVHSFPPLDSKKKRITRSLTKINGQERQILTFFSKVHPEKRGGAPMRVQVSRGSKRG
jgi:hypothetical protein